MSPKQTLWRGCLHAVITLALLALTAACAAASLTLHGFAQRYWKLTALLLGKLATYACSAHFHLHSRTARALKADLVAISVGIWAPSSAFARDLPEWAAAFAAMLAVTWANYILVERQQRGQGPAARLALLLAYFALTVAAIGWRYGYHRTLWTNGVALYLSSFSISPPIHHHLPPAPWHREKRNGWHEDFHLLLAAADCCFLSMAIEFLS